MLDLAAARFDGWFLATQPDNPRAISQDVVADMLRDRGQRVISCSSNLRQAFRRAQSVLGPGDRLVVFGSFHTVASALAALDKDQKKAA